MTNVPRRLTAASVVAALLISLPGLAAAAPDTTIVPPTWQSMSFRRASGPSLPRAATLGTPKYALASRNGASLTLAWTQFVYSPTHAPAANHFVVCLFESVTQDCSTTALRWTVAADATMRSAVTSSVVHGMPQIIGYTYTFELPMTLAAPRRDRQLQWTVGSCATTWEGSCTFATPGSLWLATESARP